MEVAVGARTDVGNRRPNNEDAFAIDTQAKFFIVADGMGGHQAGEVASAIAVDVIRDDLLKQSSPLTLKALKKAIERANQEIFRRSHEDPSLDHMGTTVVVAAVNDDRLLLAHVGDSRAYRLTPSGLHLMTDDHSLVFQWLKAGQISKEEARCHPQRSGLLRALGMEPEVDVDTREVPYGGEPVLLCSDGLTDMLRDEEIERILRAGSDPQQLCDQLVAKAKEVGGRDNITVVLVRGV